MTAPTRRELREQSEAVKRWAQQGETLDSIPGKAIRDYVNTSRQSGYRAMTDFDRLRDQMDSLSAEDREPEGFGDEMERDFHKSLGAVPLTMDPNDLWIRHQALLLGTKHSHGNAKTQVEWAQYYEHYLRTGRQRDGD